MLNLLSPALATRHWPLRTVLAYSTAASTPMPTTQPAIENLFRSILGADQVRPASSSDAISGLQPQLVLEPANELQLASVLRQGNDANLAVIPRGGGTKLAWGNVPARADVILSTARLNKIIEHAWADLTVSVEAGVSLRELQSTLARHNQRLAIDVLWPKSATIGGILSTNDSGALRLRFGALRDLVIGATIALPDGTLASSGGKVVKNVAGYDLPKLVTGAFGTLGVITRAVFRLHPLPQCARTFTFLARDAADAQRLVLAIQDSQLAHTALQARFIHDAQPQLDILFEATEAGITAQAAQLKSLVAPAPITEADPPVWNARQELYSAASRQESPCAIARISVLPSQIAQTAEAISALASAHQLRANSVIQATGLGCTLFEGDPTFIHSALQALRTQLESSGGSVFLAQAPADLGHFVVWSNFGDSLPLMHAIKRQLDPKHTLNPGRLLAAP
jgi:glycolate oxidase FAD binding subunit